MLYRMAFHLSGKEVSLHLDNSIAKAYLSSQGGTVSLIYIWRKHCFKVLKTKKYCSIDKLSPLQITWLLQVCWKMLCLPKLILSIDGTFGCAKRGTWCWDARYKNWWCCRTHIVWTLCTAWWAGVVGLTELGGQVWGTGQGCWTRLHSTGA